METKTNLLLPIHFVLYNGNGYFSLKVGQYFTISSKCSFVVLPCVPLCVLRGLSVGVCPPHMCDGLTCLCHQGSSIIAINLGGSSRPAHGPPPPPLPREFETKEKTEDPSSPPPPPLKSFSPAAAVESSSPHKDQTQRHLRRVVKRKKALRQ